MISCFDILLYPELQVYLKPHFNYNPATDNLIPCKEAGLAFFKGDILHVVNKEDPNWWQVRRQVLHSIGSNRAALLTSRGVGKLLQEAAKGQGEDVSGQNISRHSFQYKIFMPMISQHL